MNNLAKSGNAFALETSGKKPSLLWYSIKAMWGVLALIYIFVLGLVEFRFTPNLSTIFPVPVSGHSPLAGYDDISGENTAIMFTALLRLFAQLTVIAAIILLRPKNKKRTQKIGKVMRWVGLIAVASLLFSAPPSVMNTNSAPIKNEKAFNVWANARYGDTVIDATFKTYKMSDGDLVRLDNSKPATYRVIDDHIFLYDGDNKQELPVIAKQESK